MKNSVESLLGDDHESLGQLLIELDAELAKPNIARAFELLDLFWARLAVHIRAENLHLFPALADADPSLFTARDNLLTSEEAQNVIRRLRLDHDYFMSELALTIKTSRAISGRELAPREEIEGLRQRMINIRERLDTHNCLEEELAYIWPSLLFDETTIARLCDRLRHELENLPPRFS